MKCPHCGKAIKRVTRRKDGRPGADAVIETYYRRKAAGARRVTLAKMAEETGYSYAYLKKAKRLYDAAYGWGGKKHAKS